MTKDERRMTILTLLNVQRNLGFVISQLHCEITNPVTPFVISFRVR